MKLAIILLLHLFCSEIILAKECLVHYCECPPFLPNDPSLKRSLYFDKYPYPEHYAILGRAKELHCCFGGHFTSVTWFKDGEPYPWQSFGSRIPILFARNQSLIIVNVTPQDEGQYKCVASTDENETVEHQTKLRSYSLPAFHHLPIWKDEPVDDVTATVGDNVAVNCSAIVGPQYSSIKRQPVRAVWQNPMGRIVDVNDVETLQEVTDDEMIYGLKLSFSSVMTSQAGNYICTISNNYGTLRKTVNLNVVKKETTTSPQSGSISNEVETIIESDDLRGIFRAQSKLFVSLIKMVQENPGKSQTILKQLNHFQIEL